MNRAAHLFLVMIMLLTAGWQCADQTSNMEEMTIEEVVSLASSWVEIDGVEGVGQSLKDDKDCILVFTSVPVDSLKHKIPETFKGFPVIIDHSGSFEIQDEGE